MVYLECEEELKISCNASTTAGREEQYITVHERQSQTRNRVIKYGLVEHITFYTVITHESN
jgi:hypothetical protein